MTLINIANLLADKEQPHLKKPIADALSSYCVIMHGTQRLNVELHGTAWYGMVLRKM